MDVVIGFIESDSIGITGWGAIRDHFFKRAASFTIGNKLGSAIKIASAPIDKALATSAELAKGPSKIFFCLRRSSDIIEVEIFSGEET